MTTTSPPLPPAAPPEPRGRPRRTPRRRALTLVGLGLVMAALSLFGYLGYQLFVTNWTSDRRHREITTALHESWAQGRSETRVREGVASAVLRIPRFGSAYAVPILEGTTEDVFAAGVGHFTQTAAAGQRGNYVLGAHRITHGQPFRELPELRPGDQVIVETRQEVYTYVLDTGGEDLQVSDSEDWVLAPHPSDPDPAGVEPTDRSRRLLTLVTCAELFHTDERLVVFGHLQSAERRGTAV
jgi:sortase A